MKSTSVITQKGWRRIVHYTDKTRAIFNGIKELHAWELEKVLDLDTTRSNLLILVSYEDTVEFWTIIDGSHVADLREYLKEHLEVKPFQMIICSIRSFNTVL